MELRDYAIRFCKKIYLFTNKKKFSNPPCDFDRQSANDKIYTLLQSNKPVMITRFGTTELLCINNYLCIHSNKSYFRKIIDYITDKTLTPWWFKDNFKYMTIYSGIFPPTQQTAEKFSELYLKDIPLVDLLGSFQYYEKFMPLRKDVEYVHLETLYPFFVDRPWTKALEGKKVLVVHPFDSTIKTQFQIKDKIFARRDILPEFTLITYKAVQSAAGTEVPFKDWFEALNFMENQISNIDFDICILGCGAYGLPLAAHIKRMGKKAIHMGGGMQLLFGIKGKRWDDPNYLKLYTYPTPFDTPYCTLYNEFWIRPLPEDTIPMAIKVDGGTYW
jgi:hypothetical protein